MVCNNAIICKSNIDNEVLLYNLWCLEKIKVEVPKYFFSDIRFFTKPLLFPWLRQKR